MSNRDKLAYHVQAAERWQAEVLSMEDEALEEAKRKVAKDKSGQQPLYVAKALLTDNFWYNRAVVNRNGHQAQATMYGLAALLEELEFHRKGISV